MSEKIYAWLLRLYPSRFRKTYGDAALQLFRDRARDERGLFTGLLLWLDLVADLAVSIPLEYRRAQRALIGASAQQRLDGTPRFQVLENGALRLEAQLCGGLVSLLTFGSILVLCAHGGSHRPLAAWPARPLHPSAMPSSASARPAPAASRAEKATMASGQPAMGAGNIEHGNTEPRGSLSSLLLLPEGSGSPQAQAPQSRTQRATSTAVGGVKPDYAERQRVIDSVIANLKRYYVDPDMAQKLAEALLAREKAGDYHGISDGAAFAALLTRQLRDVSQDTHLEVIYRQVPLPNRPPGPSPEGMARYRAAMEQQNCTFEKVEMLPHHIGYLKLNSFPEPSVCESTAKAAMASLNDASAIVFDLRDNRGGYPGMVMLIAAYLFDHPEYMYNPRENTTEQSWTRSPVPGNRLADKPAYVLVSARTFSGAEHFSYDLKMLKRATLVGETTGGATDVGNFRRIDDHFGMGIRETKAINPYPEPDWAVTGVGPDVKVKAADALETALKLLESKLQKK
jgi:hypothetical protein